MKWALPLMLGASAAFAACTGSIGDTPAAGQSANALCPGEQPIRRLTRFEYNNTVRDLLGDDSHPADAFVPDGESLGFNNQAATMSVSQLLANQYLDAAEAISERASADMPTLLQGCKPATTGEDVCAKQFIADFGAGAFRRPLTENQQTRLFALFAKGRKDHGFKAGIELVIQAALQSPHFLYRVEFGMPQAVEPGVVRLDAWETATRLSYLLWSSMPDDTLFAAARDGELETSEQIAAQARRMLDHPNARQAVANFHRQWLGLHHLATISKNTNIYPNYYDGLRQLWEHETISLLEEVVFDGAGDLATLLTADYSMMNAELAEFYGISGPSGETFEQVSLDGVKRAGLLSHASILAAHAKSNQSSPVLRGKFVREQLLCQVLAPPPADVDVTPPEVGPGSTTAEKFAQHSEDPACKGCHRLMDPIGMGMENFDAIGQWRDTDQGLVIEADGELTETDVDGKFKGVVELGKMLAESEQVRQCVTTQWFRFGYGRAEKPEDQCSLDRLSDAFAASGYNIKELLIALTQTDAFLYRRAYQGAQP